MEGLITSKSRIGVLTLLALNPREVFYPREIAKSESLPFTAVLRELKHLGLPEKISINIHLDRINNNGHYEAGNLRWSTRQENNSHTRRSKYVERFHLFRETYPEIRYSDKTLRNLMGYGLTDAQIIERFQRPSDKPKGMYGTFSIADQEIVSLARGY